jgi:hypothetical protein
VITSKLKQFGLNKEQIGESHQVPQTKEGGNQGLSETRWKGKLNQRDQRQEEQDKSKQGR